MFAHPGGYRRVESGDNCLATLRRCEASAPIGRDAEVRIETLAGRCVGDRAITRPVSRRNGGGGGGGRRTSINDSRALRGNASNLRVSSSSTPACRVAESGRGRREAISDGLGSFASCASISPLSLRCHIK